MNTSTLAAKFPWYDSLWLQQYVAAKDFLTEHYPVKMEEFEQAMQPLRTRPDFETKLLSGVIDAAMLVRIKETLASLKPAVLELHEMKMDGCCCMQIKSPIP